MFAITTIPLGFSMIFFAGPISDKLAADPTVWKIHLQLPLVSGFHRNFRDVLGQTPQLNSADDFEGPMFGLGLSREWGGRWMVDGNVNLLFNPPFLRLQAGVQGGPTCDILNHRDETGKGFHLLFAQLFGTSYRTRGSDIIHDSGSGLGQNTLAITSRSMLDFSYFFGRWGLNARTWIDGGYAMFRWGDPVWRDIDESVDQADNYRAYMGAGLDLGVAF